MGGERMTGGGTQHQWGGGQRGEERHFLDPCSLACHLSTLSRPTLPILGLRETMTMLWSLCLGPYPRTSPLSISPTIPAPPLPSSALPPKPTHPPLCAPLWHHDEAAVHASDVHAARDQARGSSSGGSGRPAALVGSTGRRNRQRLRVHLAKQEDLACVGGGEWG